AQVQAWAAHRGVNVRGIAEQEDVSRAIPIGLSGVLTGYAAQRMWSVTDRRFDREIHSEHPTCAVTEFVKRHRFGIVRGLVELDGADHRAIGFECGVDESAVVESV